MPRRPWHQPPPLPLRESRARKTGRLVTVLLLLAYGALARVLFDTSVFHGSGKVVGWSFIFAVPCAIGMLGVAIGRWAGSDRWITDGVGIPWIVIIAGCLLSVLFQLEAAICLLMASPFLFGATFIGAGLANFLLPKNRDDYRLHVTLIALFPYLAACGEGWLQWPTETKTITDTIEIAAPAEIIWQEIASVRAIDPAELRDSWIYHVDFPRPIAATLDREGVGGIRTATFERDVSFFETVTAWQPHRVLAFSIHADPDFIPHTAFDQHVIVGGRFFDVLDGRYEIEPLPGNRCRLHLTSRHRLTTRLNGYAGWWSAHIMNEIQGSILHVIRARSEEAATCE